MFINSNSAVLSSAGKRNNVEHRVGSSRQLASIQSEINVLSNRIIPRFSIDASEKIDYKTSLTDLKKALQDWNTKTERSTISQLQEEVEALLVRLTQLPLNQYTVNSKTGAITASIGLKPSLV